MKKLLMLVVVFLGLTFLYNPSTNVGFVFVNDSENNAIVLVDPGSNSLNFYAGNFIGTERMDKGLDVWLDNMMKGGWNFKSTISPFTKKQGIQY